MDIPAVFQRTIPAYAPSFPAGKLKLHLLDCVRPSSLFLSSRRLRILFSFSCSIIIICIYLLVSGPYLLYLAPEVLLFSYTIAMILNFI